MVKHPLGDPKGAEQPETDQHNFQRDKDRECEEKSLDKTLADSFPASDPPSTIPNPDKPDKNAA